MDTLSSHDGGYEIVSLKETVQTLSSVRWYLSNHLDLCETLSVCRKHGLFCSLQESDSKVLEFLKVLSLCHTVIPEIENGEMQFRASSPDEEALVKAAVSLGIKFIARTPDTIVLDVVRWMCVCVCAQRLSLCMNHELNSAMIAHYRLLSLTRELSLVRLKCMRFWICWNLTATVSACLWLWKLQMER